MESNMSLMEQIIVYASGILMAARIIVKITPTPRDDAALNWVFKFLETLALRLKDKDK